MSEITAEQLEKFAIENVSEEILLKNFRSPGHIKFYRIIEYIMRLCCAHKTYAQFPYFFEARDVVTGEKLRVVIEMTFKVERVDGE